ncbi:MAG: DUF4249 family protein [candidate division WOR-3 bacterium]
MRCAGIRKEAGQAIGNWGLVSALLLLVCSCDRPLSEQFVPRLAVHGLLVAGPPARPGVYVNRTYAITEPFERDFSGAEVLIWRAQDTWRLDERDTSYYYSTAELEARPFDEFRLRVTKPGLDTLYSRTVVPDRFSILYPTHGDTVGVGDSLVWTRSRFCKGYYMVLKEETREDTLYAAIPIPNESLPGMPYDTAVARIPMFFLNRENAGPFTLHLLACDTNYYDWIEALARNRPGSDSAHVTGGVGVFGSVVQCSVRVFVRRDTSAIQPTGCALLDRQ